MTRLRCGCQKQTQARSRSRGPTPCSLAARPSWAGMLAVAAIADDTAQATSAPPATLTLAGGTLRLHRQHHRHDRAGGRAFPTPTPRARDQCLRRHRQPHRRLMRHPEHQSQPHPNVVLTKTGARHPRDRRSGQQHQHQPGRRRRHHRAQCHDPGHVPRSGPSTPAPPCGSNRPIRSSAATPFQLRATFE